MKKNKKKQKFQIHFFSHLINFKKANTVTLTPTTPAIMTPGTTTKAETQVVVPTSLSQGIKYETYKDLDKIIEGFETASQGNLLVSKVVHKVDQTVIGIKVTVKGVLQAYITFKPRGELFCQFRSGTYRGYIGA